MAIFNSKLLVYQRARVKMKKHWRPRILVHILLALTVQLLGHAILTFTHKWDWCIPRENGDWLSTSWASYLWTQHDMLTLSSKIGAGCQTRHHPQSSKKRTILAYFSIEMVCLKKWPVQNWMVDVILCSWSHWKKKAWEIPNSACHFGPGSLEALKLCIY